MRTETPIVASAPTTFAAGAGDQARAVLPKAGFSRRPDRMGRERLGCTAEAAKEMSRFFPGLWATKKAAERWLPKNPPEAYRDIIRVWGVLNAYRPPGQTSRSRALVRHGADPGEALAAVLGIFG
jgi:hypothetical protein